MPSTERSALTLRHEYIDALDGLDAASEQLTQALANSAAAREVVREHLQRDAAGSDFEQIVEPGLRSTLSTTLDDFERARHRAQRIFFRLVHTEGKPMREIGETWGVSRQLVSRMINEPE